MRSFFKRPSWANTGDAHTAPEFYRRADQTYGDIVAASREARIRSINHGCDLFPEDEKASKGQHSSEDNRPGDVALSVSENKQMTNRQCEEPDSRFTGHSEINEDNACRSSSTKPLKSSDMSVTGVLPSGAKDPVQTQPAPRRPCVADIPVRTPTTIKQNNDALATPTHGRDQCGDDKPPSKPEINHSHGEDVTVQLLISSRIAKTKPLVIRRKMYQPLRDVRLAWCEHQNLPRELHPFVFLTWKSRRLFDVTTCRSLGIHTNRDSGTSAFRDEPSDDCGGVHIHMEAVMDDRVPSYQSASSEALPGQHLEEPANVEDKTETRSINLVFKCPGHANYNMHADSQTRISELVAAYRDTHNIRAEQTVYLTFDGDCLDPTSCPADYDMTHDDLVDVIIK